MRFDWFFVFGIVVLIMPVIELFAFFAVALVLYLSARSRDKREPGSVPPNKMNVRRTMLIVASHLFGTVTFAAVGVTTFWSGAI